MTFNPQIVEANISLGRVKPENLPSLAIAAMEAGYDGVTIRRLAGLTNPSGWEVDQLIPHFMAELNLRMLPRNEATVRVAYHLARTIIDERRDPRDFVAEFEQLWIASDYVSEIQPLGSMDDQAYLADEFGDSPEKVRADLHDTLVEFLRQTDGILG